MSDTVIKNVEIVLFYLTGVHQVIIVPRSRVFIKPREIEVLEVRQFEKAV